MIQNNLTQRRRVAEAQRKNKRILKNINHGEHRGREEGMENKKIKKDIFAFFFLRELRVLRGKILNSPSLPPRLRASA
jgi:hypothetical protein